MDVVSRPTLVDEFPSASHKPMHLVFTAKKTQMKMLVQQVSNHLSGESGGEATVGVDCRKEEEDESVSLPLSATLPKVATDEDVQARQRGTMRRQLGGPLRHARRTRSTTVDLVRSRT